MKYFLAIIIWMHLFSVSSQVVSDIKRVEIIERTLEFISEANENAEIDYTTSIEDYYLFLENPINLNQASFDIISRLNLLSDIQIQSIIDYRYQNQQFLTVYELGAIPELEADIISILLPFVYVGALKQEKMNWKQVSTSGKHDIILSYQRVIEEKKGYLEYPDSILLVNPNKVYQGSPDKYLTRYRYTYKNKMSYGFTAEKDPGETFFRDNNKHGFDFYSAHLMLNDIGLIKKVIVGDFHANFGQGLNIWTGFNIGRTVQTLNVKQFGTGLRPYTSANESRFFRGCGISLNFNKIEATVFGSFKKLDASFVDSDTLGSDDIIDNFLLTGYHRTLKEIERKNSINELVFGSAASYRTRKMKINISGIYSHYGGALKASNLLFKQFDFYGKTQFSLGLDYHYIIPKVTLFGEMASALNGKLNAINGIIWRVDSKVDLVIVHRYFDKENQNLFGNNFTRNSQNESGLYFGSEIKLTSQLKVSIYYDQSKSNWLTYLVDGPSAERSFLGQIDYPINKYASFYLRIRTGLRARNAIGSDNNITPQFSQQKRSVRLNYSQQINKEFSIKSRIEFSQSEFNGELSNGLLMYQDIIFSLKQQPLKLYARYALFDTDDYSSRIYAYENDLLYSFSVPGLFYKGFRTYLMAKYKIGRKADIWLRWSRTGYVNRDTISSGLEQINGNNKSEIKAQLKLRF